LNEKKTTQNKPNKSRSKENTRIKDSVDHLTTQTNKTVWTEASPEEQQQPGDTVVDKVSIE
jgi:hypothetical protein